MIKTLNNTYYKVFACKPFNNAISYLCEYKKLLEIIELLLIEALKLNILVKMLIIVNPKEILIREAVEMAYRQKYIRGYKE